MDHLDNLNDITLECGTLDEALRFVEAYCDANDLDPSGYDVVWACEAFVVFTAE